MAKATSATHYMTGPKKGQFKPGSRKKKRAPAKRKASGGTRKAASRRRTYRRNPRQPDVVKMFMAGTMTAGQVLIGKAAARAVPDMMDLPKEGNTGLAVQAAVAIAVGFVADMFLPKAVAASMLAGGLTAPLETMIQVWNVPWLADYLSATSAQEGVGAYVLATPPPLKALGSYPNFGRVGAYVEEDEYLPTDMMGAN